MTALAWLVPASASGSPSELDARQREAARLEAQIERQGAALSRAAEEYNTARLEVDELQGRLSRARRDLETAEAQWNELRRQLGQRARSLYKRPGGWMLPWLGSTSMSELARGQALANTVFSNDRELILQAERSRAEMSEIARQLNEVRTQAAQRETVLSARRLEAQRALSAQQSLLGEVEAEIGEIREAEEQRRLEEAARRAARQQAVQAEAAAQPRPRTQAAAQVSRAGPQSTPAPAPAQARPARKSAGTAVQTAADQIGKPYRWGGGGPDEFDCSGLTKYAWAAAGVNLPHSSRAQYSSLPKVGFDEIQRGDLLFFGDPIHHVGIYEGNGVMIEAPYSGENVRRRSIYRNDFHGAARP